MAKLRAGIDDLVKLLEMVNEKEEAGEEFTEEELRQAFMAEEAVSPGENTVGSVSIETSGTTSEDLSSPIKTGAPLNLSKGKPSSSPSSSPPSSSTSQPSTSSSSSSSSPPPPPPPPPTQPLSTPSTCNQMNGKSKKGKSKVKNGVLSKPENTKEQITSETVANSVASKSPCPMTRETALNGVNPICTVSPPPNGSHVNCNNRVNGEDDRSVVGETRKDVDKLLSDAVDDNVTNDSPYYTYFMLKHSITKDLCGKNLYHCFICNAIYRHSFSLKRHFIRSHINYAFLCDADLANCCITLLLSDSYQAWISRFKSSTPSNQSNSLPISNGTNVSSGSGQPQSTSISITPSSSSSPLDTNSGLVPVASDPVPSTSTAFTPQPPKSKGLYCCHACVMFFDTMVLLRAHLMAAHRVQDSNTLEAVRYPCHRCPSTFIQHEQLIRHLNSAHGPTCSIQGTPEARTSPVSTSSVTPASTLAVIPCSSSSPSSSSSPPPAATGTTITTAATSTPTTVTNGNKSKGTKRKKGSSSCSTSSSSGCDQKNSSSEEKCDDEDDNSNSSQERNVFTCNQCPYKCKSPGQLKKHITARHPNSSFKCAYCKIQATDKKSLIEHLTSVHSKSLIANNRLLKSMSAQSKSSSTPTAPEPTPSTSGNPSNSLARGNSYKNTISTRSLKRRRVNRRGATEDEDYYVREIFECHECFVKFTVATDVLKHAETVHNTSRNTRSMNNASYRDELTFYQSLPQKISENLQFYVDGKPKVQPDNNNTTTTEIKSSSINNQKPKETIKRQGKPLNLEEYNFPPGFQLYSDDEEESDANPNNSINVGLDNCSIIQVNIYNSDYLYKFSETYQEKGKDDNNNLTSFTTTTSSIPTNIDPEATVGQSKGIDVKPGTLVFICNVCGNHFLSLNDFDEHEINNHPNVFCSYNEIEYNPNIPIDIFRRQSYSSQGLLKSCKVPMLTSSTSEPSIKCTKCHNKFSTATELYQHILDCSSKSKRNSKPPMKPILPTPSPSSSSCSSSSSSSSPSPASSSTITEPPIEAINTTNTKMTKNDNQKTKPKGSTSKSTLSSPTSPVKSSPSINRSPSSTPQTSSTSVSSSSSPSPSPSTSTLSSSQKAQKTPVPTPSSSTRRSGQSTRSAATVVGDDSILASLSYNTRSSRKRKLNNFEVDLNCGLSLVKKRNRTVRYHCTNCAEVFSHHLTFAKHRNQCTKVAEDDKEEQESSSKINKTKNSDSSKTKTPTASPSKVNLNIVKRKKNSRIRNQCKR